MKVFGIILPGFGKAFSRCNMREEKDSIGALSIPDDVYYGVQTARAVENFPISGLKADPDFIWASVLIKKAAAKVNAELGQIDEKIAKAIIKAADEILKGNLYGNFVVDVCQAGAGTSHNMNTNEVIANRAIEILGGKKGDYNLVSPNDHVNCAQSTNDFFPTAMRIAALVKSEELLSVIDKCVESFEEKGREYFHIIKSGRTHLQDAVPVRLGRSFDVFSKIFKQHRTRIENALSELKVLGIGGTAAGTGLNAHPLYQSKIVQELSELTKIDFQPAHDLMVSMQSMAPFVALSSSLRNFALDITKIANDLRLMDSGPTTGLSEIKLPAVQPGSSIMPGKVNPSIVEMLNQVCFQVIGSSTTIDYSSQAGQFELNVMMPIINFNLLFSIKILTNALRVFDEKCIRGIAANEDRCRRYAEGSVSNATALNVKIGYLKTAEIVKEAVRTGKTIKEVCLSKGILDEKELEKVLDLEKQAGK